MRAEDITLILDLLPKYIVYLYPGYISIYVYYFLKALTLKNHKEIVMKAISMSFIYKVCVDSTAIPENSAIYYLSLAGVACMIPYLAYLLQNCGLVVTVCRKIGIRTSFDSTEIDSIDSGKYSAWVKIYLSDTNLMYAGYLGDRELERDKKQFVILKQFEKYMMDTNGKISEKLECHDSDDDQVIIYMEEIKRIERITE